MRAARGIPYTCKGGKAAIPAVRSDFCPACGKGVLSAAESERAGAAMLDFDKRVNASIVHPAFVARVRGKYDRSAKRCAGRPRTEGELEAMVVRLAGENRDEGYRRIQGALSNLGHEIAESTIAAILKRHGREPAPERTRKTAGK